MRVVVLMGGISAEREVSFVSGRAVAEALRGEGFDVVELDAHPATLEAALREVAPDVVFNALHGDWGEDGEAQRVLDGLRLPYTHSSADSSRLAMNKDNAKAVLEASGVDAPRGTVMSRNRVGEGGAMTVPYVVKPNGSGSSASVYLVFEETPELLAKMAADEGLGEEPVVERYIPGRELTVTVMDGKALAVTEIIPDEWYSFEEKYGDGAARHVLPADIPDDVRRTCMDYAQRAHTALGCSGLTRTDFRYDDTAENAVDNGAQTGMANRVVTLELNTQPGMTPTSLAPEQAAWCGIGFGELCRWIVEDASWPRGEEREDGSR